MYCSGFLTLFILADSSRDIEEEKRERRGGVWIELSLCEIEIKKRRYEMCSFENERNENRERERKKKDKRRKRKKRETRNEKISLQASRRKEHVL